VYEWLSEDKNPYCGKVSPNVFGLILSRFGALSRSVRAGALASVSWMLVIRATQHNILEWAVQGYSRSLLFSLPGTPFYLDQVLIG